MPKTKLPVRAAGWHKPLLEGSQLRKVVYAMAKQIKESGIKFEVIAFTGVSGALVGPALAMKLNKTCAVVRRSNDDCHSTYSVEGPTGPFRYIIVDDLIDSGRTIHRIQEAVLEHARPYSHETAPELQAVFVHNAEVSMRTLYDRDGMTTTIPVFVPDDELY